MFNLQALIYAKHYFKSVIQRISHMGKKLRNTEKAVTRLAEFLTSKGWTVVIGDPKVYSSECDPSARTITINEVDPVRILWTMLHEGGHALIFGLDDYHESFGEIIKQHNWSLKRQTKKYHYQKLKEEMLAWETGLNIAKNLNIYIDEKKYDSYAAGYFMSYVYQSSLRYYSNAAKKIGAEAGIDINFENVA